MNVLEELFVHLPNFRIIVCRDCKFTVVPGQITAPLNQNHQMLTVSMSTRKAIVEQVGSLDHVAYRSEDVTHPDVALDAVRELGPVIEQCFECKKCGSLRESKKGSRQNAGKNTIGVARRLEEDDEASGVRSLEISRLKRSTTIRGSSNMPSGPNSLRCYSRCRM